MVFIDALMVKIRDGVVTNRAVYLAIGIDCDGNKQVLGLWIGPTTGESAKFWLSVLSELKSRGVADVCIVCCDGQPGWVAALTPLSVDGMIVAASTTLLAESRSGGRGGLLSWVPLSDRQRGEPGRERSRGWADRDGAGNRCVAVLCPNQHIRTANEQVRAAASCSRSRQRSGPAHEPAAEAPYRSQPRRSATKAARPRSAGHGLKRQARQWALAQEDAAGVLPTGRAIADHFGRHDRWGRFVKQFGSDQAAGIETPHRAA